MAARHAWDDRLRTLAVAGSVAIVGLVVGGGLVFAVGSALSALGIQLGVIALVVVALVVTQGIAFGGVAIAYLEVRGLGLDYVPVRVPSVRDLVWAGAGYVLSLAAVTLGVLLVIVTGAPAARNRIGDIAAQNPDVLLLLVPFSFLLIGPGEELLFRGIVQGTLREAFGPVGAVTSASAIFAAVHYVALAGGTEGRIVTIAILFLPSLVFGTAYERTRNIVVPALVHGAYNATLFGLVYASLRFGGPGPV